MKRWLLLFLAILAAGTPSRAQFEPEKLVQASLLADSTSIAAGQQVTVGVVMKLAPGWHTYWQFPGDSGGAPRVEWTLPEGFTAGPIQWPLPHPRMDEGDLLTYTYEGEVLLPVVITAPAKLPEGPVTLRAKIRWLACEKTCIPGESAVELQLPAGGNPEPSNAEAFAKWRALLPQAGTPPFQVSWNRTAADHFEVGIAGAPVDSKVEFYPVPPGAEIKPGHPAAAQTGEGGLRKIKVPIEEGGAPDIAWSGLLVVTPAGGPAQSWTISAPDQGISGKSAATAKLSTTSGPEQGLLGALLLAFIGGLILNVMPCVLPVIALKIFGFVQQAGESPQRIFRLGLAFAAGVFVFFFALATAVVALKAAGSALNWGFQFQNPFLLAGLISLVFVFALNMLGVFEVTLSSETASSLSTLSSREGYGGAFAHGLFTTLLGTSCTAPYLSTSLGYAVTQPAAIVYLLFAAIAVGMSLPYLLLTAKPAWLKFVPKPGAWMERFKQLMGFVMLAVVVWLLSVLWDSRPVAGAGMAWYLLVLGLACWVYGSFQRRARTMALAVVIVIGGYVAVLHKPLGAELAAKGGGELVPGSKISWEPFSDAKVATAVGQGKPVFIDFTADWCINCKFFERSVIETEAVSQALRDKGVLALRADWTNQDPEITKALRSFQRVGVPLYVLYRPGEQQPVVLDGLTKQGFLDHLARITTPSPAQLAAGH